MLKFKFEFGSGEMMLSLVGLDNVAIAPYAQYTAIEARHRANFKYV